MMKPDFSKMTRQELRAYILANREDEAAAIASLINRGNPNSPKFPFPQTDADFKAMQAILRDKLKCK